MNKRLFIFVIILMGISLAGIILLQLFWIRNAIDIREEHFNKSVNAALRETVEKLESHENIMLLGDHFQTPPAPELHKVDHDSAVDSYIITTDSAGNTSYRYNLRAKAGSDYVVSVWTEDGDETEIIEYKHEIRIDSIKKNIARVKADTEIDSLSQFFTHDIVFVGNDSTTIIEGDEDNYVIVKKANDLNEAFIKLAYEIESTPLPIQERIDTAVLEEVLKVKLYNKGIYGDYEYGILQIDSIKSFPVVSECFDTDHIEKKYLVSLFPNELLDVSNYLILQFPGRNVHLLKSMAWTLAGSLLLTIIILITFSITIFMILRQKKLSDIKSDFINNMTHEFKTPIATISLAVDSINNPKIIENQKEVKYYTGIIREENQRMNNQVENVLRMSLLDKHDLEFNIAETDIHELISQSIAKLSLLLKERKGSISTSLEASDPIVQVDSDHMTNALLNLLDNAIKYSEGAPEISVSTEDTSNGIILKVSDKGMGMSRDVSHRIFDRFYRKTSGNIHNIKGFGLGLSYVKAIIDAFNGKIKVISEPGKGSTFEVILPSNDRK